MTYIFIFSIAALVILSVYLFFKYSVLKVQYDIERENFYNLEQEHKKIEQEREELIKNVEHLSTSLKLTNETKEESLKNSKAVLYDLSNSVANQLLAVHKKEVEEARKQSEEKITKSTEMFNLELQKVANLVGALNKDVESSKNIVDKIKNSLLSPSSSGALAEITLENLLKNSGLRKDIDFIMQYSFKSSDNNKLRPDVLVKLPDDNLLIIDAKSSQFLMEDGDISLEKSMNIHLKNLSSKDYLNEVQESLIKKSEKVNRISLIMFLPTEQALEKVIDLDKNFLQKAWNLNIYPVGPTGLMNILSITKMHINEKLRIENYEVIISEINSLINSVSIISEHAFKLGNSVSSIVSNYDKFAASFNRNIVSKIKNLKTLGTGGVSKQSKILERYQLVSSSSDLIELDEENKSLDQKKPLNFID